jgi:hypothetical protein
MEFKMTLIGGLLLVSICLSSAIKNDNFDVPFDSTDDPMDNSTDSDSPPFDKPKGMEWLCLPLPTEPDRMSRSVSSDSDLFIAKRYCGFSPKVRLFPSTFGQGVNRASPGQYPWSVAILSSDDSFLCAGSLISESIVLTTATCILNYRKNNQPLKVILGAYSLPIDINIDVFPQLELFAASAVIHPSYSAGSSDHNIGLLRLSSNVDYDLYPWIFPVCVVGSSLEQYAGTSQCKALSWPDMPAIGISLQSKTKFSVASIDIQVSKSSCPSSAKSCITGPACNANEGSEVICLANSQRYYQWGLIAAKPNCDSSSTTTLVTVSVIENYDFIAKYLWTVNPNINSVNKS